jgi:hypothetical protein
MCFVLSIKRRGTALRLHLAVSTTDAMNDGMARYFRNLKKLILA